MSNQQEGSDTGSVSSSESCEQVGEAAKTTFASAPWTWTAPDEKYEPLPAYAQAAVWDNSGDLVCAVTGQMAGDGSVESASDRAPLIAAAPDLLEACKAMVEAVDPDSGYADHTAAVEASRKAEKAIAKVEGEA